MKKIKYFLSFVCLLHGEHERAAVLKSGYNGANNPRPYPIFSKNLNEYIYIYIYNIDWTVLGRRSNSFSQYDFHCKLVELRVRSSAVRDFRLCASSLELASRPRTRSRTRRRCQDSQLSREKRRIQVKSGLQILRLKEARIVTFKPNLKKKRKKQLKRKP